MENNLTLKEYVTSGEAAVIISEKHGGFTEMAVRAACARGSIPGIKRLGKTWLIPRAWAENYIPSNRGKRSKAVALPVPKKDTDNTFEPFRQIGFRVDESLFKQFNTALSMTGDTAAGVLKDFVRKYIREHTGKPEMGRSDFGKINIEF